MTLSKMKKALVGAMGAGVLLGSIVLSAAPASAATANGSIGCTGVRSPQLTVNASQGGNGRWTNQNTSETRAFSFGGGQSVHRTGWLRVVWNVQNGSGFWYSPPAATCI